MNLSNVQDLPGPPLLERLFLVSPIPTALAAVLLGVVLFEVLRRRAKRGPAWASFVIGVVLGGIILVVGAQVETTREVIRHRTERFVELAVAGDRDRIEDMIADRFLLVIAEGEPARSADWVLDRVEELGGIVAGNQTRWRGAELRSAAMARGRITLRTQLSFAGGSGRFASSWDFVWQRSDDGTWRVVKVEALSVNGHEPRLGLGTVIPH